MVFRGGGVVGQFKTTSGVFLFSFLFFFSSFFSLDANAIDNESEEIAHEEWLTPTESISSINKEVVDETAIINEQHDLIELLNKDPKKNLAYLHPSIAMNAPQRIASWIHYAGVNSIPDPEYGNGNVNFYRAFSGGIPEAGGKMINGQFEAIQTFVDYVFAAARGDGSASKMLLLVGPAGTGKTYFLGILSNIAEALTATSPDHFVYSYEWKNLSNFPELYPVLNIQHQEDGSKFEHPFPCPLNESPLNLIPESYASEIVKLVTDRVIKLAKVKPAPRRYHCPHCHEIRTTILKTYMKEKGLSKLSPDQEVIALAPHVRIKRLVVGANGTMAKLDAEPKDVDFQGLLTSPNAFVFHSFGQRHPMSYYLSGKILQSNGNLLVMDEFFRDDEGFRDQALNLIEEHKIRRGGAPEIELDTLVIGASNYESIERARTTGAAKAHIDRTRRVRMGYLLNPYLEAKNLLAMKNIHTVLMQELDSGHLTSEDEKSSTIESQKAPVVPANLEKLFPLPHAGGPLMGPDHRYKLWFDVGPNVEPVHLSPHTLMYMAMTVTGSRLVTDPQKALKLGEKGVIKDAAFRDVFTRLQILMRQYSSINAADLSDLRSLSRDLKEGDEGISERDAANVWLTQTISEAQRPENGNCLTPDLARKVFLRLLEEGAIEFPDNKTRIRWTLINEEMILKYLVPAIQNDVNTALGAGFGAVNSMYDEIFQEILALSLDKSATTYQASSGEHRPINQERLAEIQALYKAAEHRDFNYGEVTATHARNSMSTEKQRHLGLLRAVKSYLAKRSTDLVTFDDIQRFSESREGSSEVRQKANELSHTLAHQLGYCDRCMKAALMLTRQTLSRVEQVKNQQK
jgi:predicted Ser/Thr protein kinase